MTMLRNFDDFDTPIAPHPVQQVVTEVPKISSEIAVRHLPSEARGFVGKDADNWTWSDLRDYVVTEIEKRFGAFPRDTKKEYGIFNSYLSRWGTKAPVIARAVFEVHDGMWRGAPVSINRFCKNSDAYFSEVIAENIVDTPVRAW